MTDVLDRVEGKLVYAADVLDLFYVASAGQDKSFIRVVEDVVENTPIAGDYEHLKNEHRETLTKQIELCDIIINQKVEIEKLQTELDLSKAFSKEVKAEFTLLKYKYNKTLNQLEDYQSIARTEAIKEFEERLIELYTDEHITDEMRCSVGIIKQNIYDVKEIMVGDNNAKRQC